ncbi:MAG: hypothetical protein IIA50_02180 [Bacteroidetes bacterium]|nr:hypothetical protein [Bacteroidota bacterium]
MTILRKREAGLGMSLGKWLLGFCGAMLLVALIPRTLFAVLRRVFARSLREILAVVVTGLITEKLSKWLDR